MLSNIYFFQSTIVKDASITKVPDLKVIIFNLIKLLILPSCFVKTDNLADYITLKSS